MDLGLSQLMGNEIAAVETTVAERRDLLATLDSSGRPLLLPKGAPIGTPIDYLIIRMLESR